MAGSTPVDADERQRQGETEQGREENESACRQDPAGDLAGDGESYPRADDDHAGAVDPGSRPRTEACEGQSGRRQGRTDQPGEREAHNGREQPPAVAPNAINGSFHEGRARDTAGVRGLSTAARGW